MATESGLGYTLVPPKSFTRGRKSGQPSVIVIHTTEGSAHSQSAEDGAAYDQRRTDGTSAHFYVDSNSIVQCVLTTDEAHTARAHGNDVGIQIEICGRAGWGSSEWGNAYGTAALRKTAELCVKLRKKYPGRFPLRRLSPHQLRSGERGFAGHVDCTNAWPEDNGTHTDPGNGFPWARLFTLITELEEPEMTKEEVESAVLEALESARGKKAVGGAVWNQDGLIPAPDDASPNTDGTPNTHWSGASYLKYGYQASTSARTYANQALQAVKSIVVTADVDEDALAAAVGPIVAAAVVAALPEGSDAVSQDEVDAAVQRAFREAFSDAAPE